MKINVIDSIMGSGKTSGAINYINNNINNKYIYITPYLEEVKRIIKKCPNANFKQPDKYGTKINGLKFLLETGQNIVTTHALFHLFDDEIIELCYSQGYILFMDEVTDVVEQYNISAQDLSTLLNNYIYKLDNGVLKWREDKLDYYGKFSDVKQLCENESLALYGTTVMMWMFPIKIFRAFEESYILTYMFDAQMQKYYYDFYNLEYNYMHIEGDDYRFVDGGSVENNKYNYSELINIVDNAKLNRIGEINYSLSKSWYEKHKEDILMKNLRNNMQNFFINIAKSSSDDSIWTTFKDYKNIVKGKGYTKGFVSCNARATNEFRDRHNIAYVINKYFNPVLKQFFIMHGVEIHEDRFALSEMLQFIWRSAIRQGEPITLYIPSKRMRELLQLWIADQIKS